MPAAEKKFVLTYVVRDVLSIRENEYRYNDAEDNFEVSWKMGVVRNKGWLGLFLYCDHQSDEQCSIEANYTLGISSFKGNKSSENYTNLFDFSKTKIQSRFGCDLFMSWEEMEKDYMIDEYIVVEAHVTILKMTGIKKKKLRSFDESMKDFSDVALIVGDEKFYALKLFLASQSTYFEALFLRKFKESEKSEITLNDVDSKGFQNFLELLYGESPINEDTVEGISKLADMYHAKLAIQKCEDFLINESEKTLKKKLQMAAKYNLSKLKNDCLSKINTIAEIRSVLSYDTNEMDPSVVGALLQKSLSLAP